MKRLLFCWGFALSMASAGWSAAPSLIAIRNARIVTGAGDPIAKGTVVVRDGLIADAGENVRIPPGAWIVEGDGLTVYPGLVDAVSSAGITDPSALAPAPQPRRTPGSPPPPSTTPPAKGPEDRPATTSWLRAADLVHPSDPKVAALRSLGFTTAVSFPMRGILCGEGAVIDLAGGRGGDMVVASPVGQYITMHTAGFSSYPGSLLGVIAYIRQVYIDAARYRTVRVLYAENPRGGRRPEYDRASEGVLESPRMLLPAQRKVEMDRMIRFAAGLKEPAVLYGLAEGYRAADLLKAANVPVLVSLKWPARSRDADPDGYETLRTLEVRDRAPSTPAVLARAGVPFALYLDGLNTSREVKHAVKRARDAGLSEADLVRALTLEPARIYGVSDRLGTIEKGKIANLVVTKGELFGSKTEVKAIIVDGIKFEPEPEAEPPAGGAPRGTP